MMGTEPRLAVLLVLAVLAGCDSGPATAAPPSSVGAPPGPPAFASSGAGYHDPRSPVPQLVEREGVLSWKLLSKVEPKIEKNRVVPQYPPAVAALNGQRVKVQGFMMPLDPGATQKHFLLSAVPTTCAFCVPAGPEGLIEVRSTTAVKVAIEAVLLEGKLEILRQDPTGLYYRLTEAVPR